MKSAKKRIHTKVMTDEVMALKKMRIVKRIKPEDAAESVGISKTTLLRFENGRTSFPEDRIKALIRRYRFSMKEYNDILTGKKVLPDLNPKHVYKREWKTEQEKRKYKKIITKEVRVITCMREMKGLTKANAASLTGLHRSVIDHIENGRTELTEAKIKLILKAYGYTKNDFEYMCEQKLLRPEVIKECEDIIRKLDNEKLQAVQALLQNFR